MFHIKYIKASNSFFFGWGILPLSVYLASSPCPTQNRGKGLDTLAKIPVYAVSSLFLEYRNHICPLPITKFLTGEVVESFQNHMKMGTGFS